MTLFRFPMKLFTLLLAVLLFGLAMALARYAPQAVTRSGGPVASAVQAPALGSPGWTPVPIVGNNPALQISLASPSQVTPLPTDNLGVPNNVYCNTISQLTGKPCLWTARHNVYQDGTETIEIELTSGDEVLARGNAMKVGLNEMPEITGSYPQTFGWLDYLEVAKWLEHAGFGRLLWLAMDAILARQAAGAPVVKVFVDAAGWATRLLVNTPYDQYGEKVYIYVIR